MNEPKLYKRGARGIWWVDFGDIGGVRQRKSTHERDRDKAQKAVDNMRLEFDRHRRQLRLVTLTATVAPADWADFLASPRGIAMIKRLPD